MRSQECQQFVDCVAMPCCILSVKRTAEGGCGEIRIIAANRPYRLTMGPRYYDGMIYSELVPQDNKFEDHCYRAAILKQRMRAYVETRALRCWTDQTLIPLASRTKTGTRATASSYSNSPSRPTRIGWPPSVPSTPPRR